MSKHFENIKLKLAIALSMLVGISNAQTPYQPAAYPSNTQVSFVRSWDAVAPVQDPAVLLTRPVKDVKQATQYLDGLGRPVQTVMKQGSSITNSNIYTDIVSANVYDNLGRETYKFLPTVAMNTGGNTSLNDGRFKLNPFQQQAAFYDNLNPNSPIKGQGETYFYSQTDFEASPLNRPTKSFAPGNNWVGSKGNATERGIGQNYLLNNVNDAVVAWKIDNAITDLPILITQNGGFYAAGELYKTATIDEHNKQVVEFKDKDGKVILKKVQIATTVTDGYTGWLCTYYIYDDFGQLRFVISPKACEVLALNNWLFTNTTLGDGGELCFKYEYDAKGRLIKKKVPGAAEVWMIYDARDRLVLTQEGHLRTQQKWMYTQYDELNRPIATGLWTSALTFAQHTTNASTIIGYPTLNGEEELTRTFYNNYDWINVYSTGLSNTYSIAYNGFFETVSNSTWPYPQANVQTNQLKGVVTGTRVKILGTVNTYLYTLNFYNEKGRVIQTQATNISGAVDVTTTQYAWAGQPLVIVQKTDLPGAYTEDIPFHIKTKMNYDDLGRVLNIRKTIYGTFQYQSIAKSEQTIVQNEYDALGQLKKKTLGANNLENLTYDYNIRGWMLGANRLYAKDAASNYFGFDLGYDKANNNIVGNQTYTNPQFNGNIEGMVWKSKGDGEKRKYDFEYDNANRLWKGNFTQYTGAVFNQTAGVNYNVKMGDGTDVTSAYDANGNIKRMQQWGWKLTGSIPIDDLNYEYLPNSNKLAKVTDVIPGDNKLGDFKDGTNTNDDYGYDINGNLNLDNNKTISAITYNHLNLPSVITVPNKGTITYTYDAAGTKIKKLTLESPTTTNGNKTITTTTTYIGGMVYESKTTTPTNTPDDDYTDRLQFIGHEEGRIRFKPAVDNIAASFQYDYMLKDHLGNVRMVLTEEIQQDIYPAATLEGSDAANALSMLNYEKQFYTINNLIVPKPWTNTSFDYPNNNGITNPYPPNYTTNVNSPSEKVYKLEATINTVQNKTGLGIVLKVMAGDVINIWGKSYHNKPTGGYASTTNPLSIIDLMNLLAASPAVNSKGITGTQISNLPLFPANVTDLLNNQPPQANNRPRASINWVVLDEQFKYVSGGFDMVGSANPNNSNSEEVFKNHNSIPSISIPKNGYIYVYCSNESKYPVFFDNLQLVHDRGPILEETHYYPFGLTMAGISSKAAGSLENRKKFNDGTELNNDFDISLYETDFRSLDPQIGRFWQTDPLAEARDYQSPFAFADNNPTTLNDPLGLSTDSLPKRQKVVTVPGKTEARVTPVTPFTPPPAPVTPPAVAPTPTPAPNPGPLPVFAPLMLPVLLTAILTSIPISTGQELSPDESAKRSWERTHYDPWPGHGNNKNNTNPHIVYSFTFTPVSGTPVLKYGISDELRYGLERPERQLFNLQLKYGFTVKMQILTRTINRQQALLYERQLVTRHVNQWGIMPLAQLRPGPF